jgi:hypothetical protein
MAPAYTKCGPSEILRQRVPSRRPPIEAARPGRFPAAEPSRHQYIASVHVDSKLLYL